MLGGKSATAETLDIARFVEEEMGTLLSRPMVKLPSEASVKDKVRLVKNSLENSLSAKIACDLV